jgi:ribulose-phosphate 3-epimerase
MKVTPAIIPQDYNDLQNKLSRLKGLVQTVQIDVCDGKLTPKPSWPYANDPDRIFDLILNQEEGLPMWEDFDFEIDMMVIFPDQEFNHWIDAGASRIVIHHYDGQEERTKQIFNEVKDRGSDPVICFEASTSIEKILAFEPEYLKNIQLMGIAHDGFQGEPFVESTIEKVKRLQEQYPDIEIAIDGGVNMDTALKLAEAGADRLIIGSALFNSGDLTGSLDYFESL